MSTILTSIACVLVGVLMLTIALAPFYFKFGKFIWFYHDIMKWHTPDEGEEQTYDGVSIHSKCKYCHQEIIQDSQGNWYTF